MEATITGTIKNEDGEDISSSIVIEFEENGEDFPIYFKYLSADVDGGPIIMPKDPPRL
jgi:hypothetical protein